MEILHGIAIIMAAAIVVVSISKKTGFGSILGYILAGVAIGPWGLNFIIDTDSILHFAEVGIVLLLFLIGLELQPKRLWLLRKSIFGLGALQVFVTSAALIPTASFFVSSWVTAAVVGFGLSLSSTAFALQMLAEKKRLDTPHGRSSLHVLLFQDLAAIPALAIVPILAIDDISTGTDITGSFIKIGVTLLAFFLFARYLLRPTLRFVATIQTHEIFTATALLLVLGSALVMESIGISMALGAFLAGVLVADSEYRHQLEADILPFKGLLLGLFFMAIGMSTNLGVLASNTTNILWITLGIVTVKSVLLFFIAKLTKHNNQQAISLALCLSQGGEFGFILFAIASGQGLLDPRVKDLLTVAVTLSMASTPLLVLIQDIINQRLTNKKEKEIFDEIDSPESKVILAGAGRFGQIILRILRTQGIAFTAIDIDPKHVDFVRKLGNKVYFGDACSKKLLDTADTASAKIFVLAIDNVEASIEAAELIKREYPDIRLFARARTRMHEMRLRSLGAEFIIRDTLLSSMDLAEKLLVSLDFSEEKAAGIKNRFYQHDLETLDKQYHHRDDQKMLIKTTKEAAEELEAIFSENCWVNIEQETIN